MKHACLLSLLSLAGCSEPEWKVYPIDTHLTVRLPVEPQALNLDSTGVRKVVKNEKLLASVQAYGAKDDYAVYSIAINTAPQVAESDDSTFRDSLYARGIRTALRANKGSRLLTKEVFSTSAGAGVAIKVDVISPTTGAHELVYNRLLLTGGRAYSFTFSPTDQDTTLATTQRRRFFNSIAVKP